MRTYAAKSVGVTTPLQLKVGSGYGAYEASPHITTLRLKLTVSGTRSVTYPYTGGPEGGTVTITENLDYTQELTLTREVWSPEESGMYVDNYGYGEIAGGFAYGHSPSAGKFMAITLPWLDFDINDVAMMIGQQGVELYCNLEAGGPVGTWEITHSDVPDLDSSGNLPGMPMPVPGFGFVDNDAGNHRLPFNLWVAPIIAAPSQWGGASGTASAEGVDLTAWSATQWRSKAGVHSFSFTESEWTDFDPDNNATTDVVLDYEWELS